MSAGYLTCRIQYDVKKDEFIVNGDLNREGRSEVIEGFLRGQMGKGRDRTKPEKRDVYHITLNWYPENDRIEVSSDTGNKGLREGILMRYLARLSAEENI